MIMVDFVFMPNDPVPLFTKRRKDVTIPIRIRLWLIVRVTVYFVFRKQDFFPDPFEVIRYTIYLDRRNLPAVIETQRNLDYITA
jgi:hypothetical protein